MLFPWKQFLLLSGIATLLVDTAVAVQEHQACYGNTVTQSCSQHSLQCQQGSSIFFTQAVRGFKQTSNDCYVQRPWCQYIESCCRNDTGRDCAEVYTQAAFTALANKCWNKETCNYSVQEATHVKCGNDYKSGSGYSIVDYLCLPGIDSSTLRVQCKQDTPGVSLSLCSTTSTATTRATTSTVPTTQTTDTNTRPDTSVATTFPSSDGTGASDTAAAEVHTSSTSTLAAASSSDVTKGTMPQSAENTGSTAAVVGGVVGAVVLVVVALVAIVFFLKRRSATGKTFKGVAWFKGGKSSMSSYGKSGRAEPHVTYAQPTSLPVYENSAATISDEAGVRVDADSDYNHLGQKPTSSASRDVTYGHLTDGSDATDYGYDHVTKGKAAIRSGDVIDNVYNTAGPATGDSYDEDFYNTTSTAKNRPDVINNVYNTPSPATEASPDVDYYNTAGLPQPGCDVISNFKDIPKLATVPGPSETEASDVTGADISSPYEFARAVK